MNSLAACRRYTFLPPNRILNCLPLQSDVLKKKADLLTQLEEQFRTHPANRALAREDASWTYQRLNAVSASCASRLQNGSPDFAPVALLMRHDVTLIAAMVGVLRSGGFYVVLNPTYSIARIRQICDQVRPRAIITSVEHVSLARDLAKSSGQVFLFDDLTSCSGPFVKLSLARAAPCALFYTSGSLGVPKPLVYTHGATFQNVTNYSRALNIQAHDRLSLLSPCSAAASASSIFGALLNGASVHPFEPVQQGLTAMASWIEREQITIYHSVPSLFRRFLATLEPDQILPSVRLVKLGGEPVFAADIDLFRRHFREDAVLINGLGMTEANGNVCHYRVARSVKLDSIIVPVGRPLDGVDLKLLSPDNSEVAGGEVGEIALRGRQIAPSFWTGQGVKYFGIGRDGWFRSGDLGRKNDAGLLEHLGRKDNQLKRRGQWVSLAEVEAALIQFDGVKEVAAIAFEQGNREKGIAAFLSWKETPISEREVRQALALKLPAHAFPNCFFTLANLPILPNGKLDRIALSRAAEKVLPKVAEVRSETFDSITLELLSIWKQVLERGDITIKDDFFAFGGDSLAAAAIMAAVEKIFCVNLPTGALLNAPTVEKLAKTIRNNQGGKKRVQVVGYRLDGKNPPLYYVPGAGCEAFELKLLPRHLPTEQAILAFQPRGLDGRSRYQASVEAMAKSYLAHVRVHQPHGPYYLCGNCFGGVVAFEMAQRLVAAGEKVAFLGLFDSYGGDYPKPRASMPISNKQPFKVESFLSKLFGCIGEVVKDPNYLTRKLCEIDVALRFSLFARDYESRTSCFRRLCGIARRRYRMRPFPGRIVLFRTDDLPSAELYEPDPLLGWNGMALGGIEIHELPGRHGDYMREPQVQALAEKLVSCLARARATTEASADEAPRANFVPI
jgi:acyl-coenzyme A synthetase/AMP-(fatty) acid ligase/thioesterase domain-containing protein/acyl carrier protein